MLTLPVHKQQTGPHNVVFSMMHFHTATTANDINLTASRASHPADTATAETQQLYCDTETKLRSSNLHSNVHPRIVPAPAILSRSCDDQASRTHTTCNTIHTGGCCTKGKHARQHQGTKQRPLPPPQPTQSEDLLKEHLCMRTRGMRWHQGMPPSSSNIQSCAAEGWCSSMAAH
jgi:hypothetical protein